MSVDEFLLEKDIDVFSRKLLDAFEYYVKNKNLIKIEEIFGDYFSITDRYNSFMTQIELNFFDKMESRDEILFSKILKHTLILYDLNKHKRETLLYLLDFVLYIKLYDISDKLTQIWEALEKIGFKDESNRAFALNILRYIVAFPNPNSSKKLVDSILNSHAFHLDFAALILIYKGKEERESLPRLLSKFSSMKWEQKENKKFFDKVGKTLIRERGLDTIVYIIKNANFDSLWFINHILKTKRIEVSLDGRTNVEMFIFKNHKTTIEVMSKDIITDRYALLIDVLVDNTFVTRPPSVAVEAVTDKEPLTRYTKFLDIRVA